jgi:hypothetical protein
MSGSPPLRFLLVVIGGWAALRATLLAPPRPPAPAGPVAVAVAAAHARAALPPDPEIRPLGTERIAPVRPGLVARMDPRPLPRLGRPRTNVTPPPPPPSPEGGTSRVAAAPVPFLPPPAPPAAAPGRTPAPTRRWSLSAWSFVRSGGPAALAAGGLLGGSQAGARLTWRLDRSSARPLALSFRLSAALRRRHSAEAALGLDWQPDRRLPVHLLAERRQALGPEGRSAFAVAVHGGVGDSRLGPFRIDAYAQAGLVGARSRDPFGDGALRLSLPLDERARVGGGAWAAAQPGLSRLDIGPQASIRLPVAGRAVTLAADWRLRVAGNARPGSGPALTVATDF